MILNGIIKQLTLYLHEVLLEGVDFSALLIIEAHLTTIKSSISPPALMMNLFSVQEIKKMLSFSKEYFQKLRQRFQGVNRDRKFSLGDVNDRFKISVKELELNSMREISVVSEQILQTLEEWDSITLKTEKMKQKLLTLTDYGCSFLNDQTLKQGLQEFILLTDLQQIERDFKMLTESTECFSSLEESQLSYRPNPLKVSDIAALFQYILIWSNQIQKEISDFSTQIEHMKEDSSVDLQEERCLMKIKETSITNHFIENARKAERQMTFCGLQQKRRRGKQNENFNLFAVESQKRDLKKKQSISSFNSKDLYPQYRRKQILAGLDCHHLSTSKLKKPQIRIPTSQRSCQRCQIY